MVLASLDFVVSFTSQDENHPAANLLTSADGVGSKKSWLCSPSYSHSARLEALFQLDRASTIDYINVGNHGSATFEVWVGRSCWEPDHPLSLLLPTVMLMNPVDSRAGVNGSGVRMFNAEHFNEEVATEQWDRLKVVCTQPFSRGRQFGLSFLQVERKVTDELPSTEPERRLDFLRTPTSSKPADNSLSFTPPNALSRGALILAKRKGLSPSTSRQGRTAEEVAKRAALKEEAAKKDDEEMEESVLAMSPSQRRNAVALMDTAVNGTGREKRKRKQVLEEKDVTEEVVEAVEAKVACMQECPICSDIFRSDEVEAHAANCQDDDCQLIEPDSERECPICKKLFLSTELEAHADACALQNFGDLW